MRMPTKILNFLLIMALSLAITVYSSLIASSTEVTNQVKTETVTSTASVQGYWVFPVPSEYSLNN